MLQSLTIENIAVIKSEQLELPAGFVTLTGETGAGKSILIDAINVALGERAGRDLIRTGADTARVAALFSHIGPAARGVLEELDLPLEDDGTLLLSRAITAGGKNNCRVNGEPVTVSVLRRVGASLLNIHGQHDSQALLNPQSHVKYIDAMAGNEALRAQYREAYHHLRALQQEHKALQMDETEKERRLETLRHQIAELEQANIQPGERAALQERREVMMHSEKILAALDLALRGAAGEDDLPGAAALSHSAAAALAGVGDVLPPAEGLSSRMRSAAYELEECAAELRSLLDTVTFDPIEADAVEQRLDLYYRLSRKYGQDEADMLAFLVRAQTEEASVIQSGERILALEEELEAARAETIRLAKLLSKSRREAGERFALRVREELADLDMPQVRLEARAEKIPLTADGGERMEFLISANAGEEPRPLAKIASGGELSRVMLAIKAVLADKDLTDTLIFDEIDAGVSGRAAQKIGRKLRQVSAGRQVICVTHLAQIAALADCHFYISKTTQNNETTTHVEALSHGGRARELARIMGGGEPTAAQLAAAEELLGAAL
ncbi:MAG: DNA repair protein RecN [Oscillospiraceae bacterium]|jgi:DNA repair protein RecN (Recombination protein N)|nr:DNA repair protein RecN [Oscillospiraceae bacterium]